MLSEKVGRTNVSKIELQKISMNKNSMNRFYSSVVELKNKSEIIGNSLQPQEKLIIY